MGRPRGHSGCPEPMPVDLEMRLMKGEYFHPDIVWLVEQYKKMTVSCEDGRRMLENLNSKLLKKTRFAYQFCQVTAEMLEASDDPDGNPVERSVLITKSESDYEFNWMMSGGVRRSTVVLGPGQGVNSHHVIIDRDDVNLAMLRWKAVGGEYVGTESIVARPYGMTGLKLQFGTYKPDGDMLKFWPAQLYDGVWVYLEQTLPQVVIL